MTSRNPTDPPASSHGRPRFLNQYKNDCLELGGITAGQMILLNRLAALGKLIPSLVHEISNPLAAILNLAMLTEHILQSSGSSSNNSAELASHASEMTDEANRISRILRDMMVFKSLSKQTFGPVALNDLLDKALSIVSHRLKLENINVRIKYDRNIPEVHANALYITQAALNMLLNAADALSGRRDARLSVTTCFNKLENGATIEVSDNGGGIRPEDMPKIFDPFFTTHEGSECIGLGLTVTQAIAKDHGGQLEVQTRVGTGSTIRLTLPCRNDAPIGAPEPHSQGHVREGSK